MQVSMKDIAKVAGVSLSTVSRALADSPRVKLETRRRIQALGKEMGYVPNAIARGLATKRTRTLGVVVMDITDPFIAEIVRALDKTALKYGYSIILSHCRADPQLELAAIRVLRQQRADGIIVPDPFVADASFPLLEEIGVPVILVNKARYPCSVGTDNVDAARQAVNHLLDLGHERIAYIGDSGNREESLERQTGYKQALVARGVSPDPSLIIKSDDSLWPKGGWQGIERLLNLPQPPSAVFCFNDLTAIGAIGAVHAAGLRVPDHLSVVGFDDIDLAPYLTPPLTTVAQQGEQIAQLAIEMIFNLLDGNELPGNTTLPGRLVVRGSTAPPGQR
jgi:DNA-binding LacI/PurR family transcriptional regulator